MLTYKILRVISLLKQISNASEITPDARNDADELPDSAILLDQLLSSGLIRVVSKDDARRACCQYELTKSLREITLCDVLRVTGGEIRLCFDDEKDIYDRYGAVGQRLGVVNYMTCRLLSDINLTEIVLPNSASGISNEEQKNK